MLVEYRLWLHQAVPVTLWTIFTVLKRGASWREVPRWHSENLTQLCQCCTKTIPFSWSFELEWKIGWGQNNPVKIFAKVFDGVAKLFLPIFHPSSSFAKNGSGTHSSEFTIPWNKNKLNSEVNSSNASKTVRKIQPWQIGWLIAYCQRIQVGGS